MPESKLTPALLDEVIRIAREAGARILAVYETDFSVDHKDDQSPLTAADLAAHRHICGRLDALSPRWPILSEESAQTPFQKRSAWQRYWLVDPLDGTREFIKRNGEFTVNIALVDDHVPVLGVVFVPVLNVCYYAAAGLGAFKQTGDESPQSIRVRDRPAERLRVVGSRSHSNQATQAFIARLGETEVISIGSSLKICLVAEGVADLYPRFGPTSEWDTAAAQCVVETAGGHLTDTRLQPLRYNTKVSLRNPHFVVFASNPQSWEHHLVSAGV